jgi:outer membrane lipoprotein-sorting protein
MRTREFLQAALIAVAVLVPAAASAGDDRDTERAIAELRARRANALPSPASTPTPFREAGPGDESLAQVRTRIEGLIAKVDTVSCEVEMSKKRDKKSTRKVEKGPLELARGIGARVSLSRKGQTREYIANQKVLWSYDHNDKEAQFIPTSMPVVGASVQDAMRLNAFFAMAPDTIRYRGSQEVEGDDCWVLTGKSPTTLESLGVPSVKVRVWVAKKDGVPRKIQLPDESDLVIMLRSVSVNPGVPASRFEWSPPSGVKTKNIFGF